jgi:hypothetical protein
MFKRIILRGYSPNFSSLPAAGSLKLRPQSKLLAKSIKEALAAT